MIAVVVWGSPQIIFAILTFFFFFSMNQAVGRRRRWLCLSACRQSWLFVVKSICRLISGMIPFYTLHTHHNSHEVLMKSAAFFQPEQQSHLILISSPDHLLVRWLILLSPISKYDHHGRYRKVIFPEDHLPSRKDISFDLFLPRHPGPWLSPPRNPISVWSSTRWWLPPTDWSRHKTAGWLQMRRIEWKARIGY